MIQVLDAFAAYLFLKTHDDRPTEDRHRPVIDSVDHMIQY